MGCVKFEYPSRDVSHYPFIVKQCIAIGYTKLVYVQLKSEWSAGFLSFYMFEYVVNQPYNL